MREEIVYNVNAGAIMAKYGDISRGYGRVIFLDESGEPLRSYGDIKSIRETDEGRNVLNDLCVGAHTYKNGGQVVVIFKDVGSDDIQIHIHKKGNPIFKDPVPQVQA